MLMLMVVVDVDVDVKFGHTGPTMSVEKFNIRVVCGCSSNSLLEKVKLGGITDHRCHRSGQPH